jgi:hypothetical protein
MCAIRSQWNGKRTLRKPDGAPVCKFPAPHFEFLATNRATAISLCAAPAPRCLEAFMNRDPRWALSQELEAKQTLLDQLRALAAEDPDFLTDLIEGKTNLLELIAALDASIVDDESLVDGAKAALDKLQARKRSAETASNSSAGSSLTPCSRSVSRPCARLPPHSRSQKRASRPSPSPPKTSRRAGGSRSRPTRSSRAH